jgi:multimeric flavodoxin WrbA
MKVIALNGSPRKDGNTATVLTAMAAELEKQGVQVETHQIGRYDNIRGCIACGHCSKYGKCFYDDDGVNKIADKIAEADGFILASPTYYAGIAGTMKCFLDRMFYSASSRFRYKVGTVASVVRRTGGLDVQHQLLNYLHLAEVVIPPSQYWTVVYGAGKGEVLQDAEGMQTARKNARAMAWLLKVLEKGAEVPLPQEEERQWTNFIR